MFARKGVFSSIGRAGAVATVVAVALTAVPPSMAFAGSAPVKGVTATTGTSGATDFSARGRYYRGGGGGAAAAAAFAGIVGTGLAIAATQNRRDYYDSGMVTTMPRRPITAVAPSTMAVARIIMAAIGGYPNYRPGGYTRSQRLVIAQRQLRTDKPPAASAGGFFWVVKPAVNTLATAFD